MKELYIGYSNYDLIQYYDLEHYYKDITKSLDELLGELNTFIKRCNKKFINTDSTYYIERVQIFVRCLFQLPLSDYITYNNYLNELNNIHKYNLEYDAEYIEPKDNDKPKQKSSKKHKYKDIYVRFATIDLFTGEPSYEYINYKRNDVIQSKDPNLLDELNNNLKKKKEKKINTVGMVFKFK